MLDLRAIRDDPGPTRESLARRGAGDALDEVLALDARRRELIPAVEEGRGRRNTVSEQIAQAKRAGEDADGPITAMRELSAELKRMETELGEVEVELQAKATLLPNLAHPGIPDGDSDEDAAVLREVGTPPEFDFEVRDHLDLGLAHGWIETEKAAAMSGSRFAYILGDLVMVELALVRFAVELLRGEGFEPVVPPVLVREGALHGTGYFPGEREMIYEVERDELFLVGTSEVSIASLHAGEILDGDSLPLRYAGISPCFRREAGAAGRDTRGIFRVHQFEKVEMFSFVAPEDSEAEHERLLAIEERILSALEIPYRVVDIAVGDLGNPAYRKFDCEAWIPSQGRYRELTSTSNTTDFQTRRLGARYRPAANASPRFCHTVNGTATAVGRTLIALIENGQRADGSVRMPKALVEAGAPTVIGKP